MPSLASTCLAGSCLLVLRICRREQRSRTAFLPISSWRLHDTDSNSPTGLVHLQNTRIVLCPPWLPPSFLETQVHVDRRRTMEPEHDSLLLSARPLYQISHASLTRCSETMSYCCFEGLRLEISCILQYGPTLFLFKPLSAGRISSSSTQHPFAPPTPDIHAHAHLFQIARLAFVAAGERETGNRAAPKRMTVPKSPCLSTTAHPIPPDLLQPHQPYPVPSEVGNTKRTIFPKQSQHDEQSEQTPQIAPSGTTQHASRLQNDTPLGYPPAQSYLVIGLGGSTTPRKLERLTRRPCRTPRSTSARAR
ncbi:hypothetical protein CERZMDRAFT_84537 [Cercospora zeae-maydis SCOH1-5]|uniref:Uncharacterized protein n=1 Tax=Cercospora zeae-maydis SCOH1-5 TaxID=717836 RepID=A0A6A6FFJ6_9PEZI|nr:hypothetical protein CERZMDRAFT_84537 [Cercospora zeae-maydis SCOH1-5]